MPKPREKTEGYWINSSAFFVRLWYFCQDQPKNMRVHPLERAREKWYDSLSIPQVLVPGVLQAGFRFDVRQVQKV